MKRLPDAQEYRYVLLQTREVILIHAEEEDDAMSRLFLAGNRAAREMGRSRNRRRQKILISIGIICAFVLCAINMSVLARRTSSGGTSDASFDIPKNVDSGTSFSFATTKNDSCFRARHDTVPRSLYGNLALPIINLGKMCFRISLLPIIIWHHQSLSNASRLHTTFRPQVSLRWGQVPFMPSLDVQVINHCITDV